MSESSRYLMEASFQEESLSSFQFETNKDNSNIINTNINYSSNENNLDEVRDKVRDKKILSFHVQANSLGCAYYDESNSTLYVLPNHSKSDTNLIAKIINQSKPAIVLLNSSLPEEILDTIPIKGKDLNIFHDENHPNVSNFHTGKEGISLYRILNQTVSSGGADMLKSWFKYPLNALNEIEKRLVLVEAMMKSDSKTITRFKSLLKNRLVIPHILTHLQNRSCYSDWYNVYMFITNFICISDILFDLPQTDLFKDKDTLEVYQMLKDARKFLGGKISFDNEKEDLNIHIKENISEGLDNLKYIYNNMEDMLSNIAIKIKKEIEINITRLNIVYYPQLGYLIAIPIDNKLTKKDFGDTDLDFQFESDEAIYFKNNSMRYLDNDIGDIFTLINDKEIEILQSILGSFILYFDSIIEAYDKLSELDCILSITKVSKANVYNQPEFNKNQLRIISGRNPILERNKATIITNDYDIQNINEMNKSIPVMILNGPNGSGKSIYLKQVALTCFMAHLGSYIPAEKCLIYPMDLISTCFITNNSVSNFNSGFCQDLQQINTFLKTCTKDSILFLDEFGKGTTIGDGIGLLCALVKYVLNMNKERGPRILISTHFNEIHINNLLNENNNEIKWMYMDTVLNDSNKLDFRYKLKEGYSSNSYGIHYALQNGIKESIIERAKEVKNNLGLFKIPKPMIAELDQYKLWLYKQIINKLMSTNITEENVQPLMTWIKKMSNSIYNTKISK
ncbi:hypothetical protein K502DRAFT_348420 [Neoconidiobolus thromboides FSU 785]|nr:hypothetical protein K502DRAFT_348420 [Neoconidiobolus thromboides FSU 785]